MSSLKLKSKLETLYLTVSGVQLEVEWYQGAADGPTLILLHEGLGCIEMWRDFPIKLANTTGLSVLVYSRQGYGRSAPCAVPRPLTYMHNEGLDVLPELLKVAKIKEHILIGHSDGGSIALINAGGKPNAGLQALITMAPHVFCEALTLTSIKASIPAFTEGKLRPGLEKYHHDNVDCAFWGWNKAWLDPDFVDWNIEQYLPGITVPQLIIQGNEDPYGTMAQPESIARQSAGSVRIHMLDNSAHSPYKERASECLHEISKFLITLP